MSYPLQQIFGIRQIWWQHRRSSQKINTKLPKVCKTPLALILCHVIGYLLTKVSIHLSYFDFAYSVIHITNNDYLQQDSDRNSVLTYSAKNSDNKIC